MSRTVISFSLDEHDIKRAITEVKNFKKEFVIKCNQLVKALTEYGANVARVPKV